ELDVTGVEHDRWRTRRVGRQALRLLAIEQHAALLVTEHGPLLARVIAALNLGAHAGELLAFSNQTLELLGAEAASHGDEVQRFEQAGLALAIVSRDDVEARRRFELDQLQIAKRSRRHALEANQRRHGSTFSPSASNAHRHDDRQIRSRGLPDRAN